MSDSNIFPTQLNQIWPTWSTLLVFLLLIPLATFVFFPEHEEDVEKRVKETINSLPMTQRLRTQDLVHEKASWDEILKDLPGKRIRGAALPRDSLVHLLFALIAATGFLGLLFLILNSLHLPTMWAFGISAFTATVGVFLLITIQTIAIQAAMGGLRGLGIIQVVAGLIGYSYYAALDPGSNLFVSFLGFTFGVGLCEEFCKVLIPLLYLKDVQNREITWIEALFWGASAGIGFGLAEGILYAGDQYNGLMGWRMYITRFFSCVGLHAVFSASAALSCYQERDSLRSSGHVASVLLIALQFLLPVMVLHGLYDTLLKKKLDGGALFVAIISIELLVVQIAKGRETASRVAGVPTW